MSFNFTIYKIRCVNFIYFTSYIVIFEYIYLLYLVICLLLRNQVARQRRFVILKYEMDDISDEFMQLARKEESNALLPNIKALYCKEYNFDGRIT